MEPLTMFSRSCVLLVLVIGLSGPCGDAVAQGGGEDVPREISMFGVMQHPKEIQDRAVAWIKYHQTPPHKEIWSLGSEGTPEVFAEQVRDASLPVETRLAFLETIALLARPPFRCASAAESLLIEFSEDAALEAGLRAEAMTAVNSLYSLKGSAHALVLSHAITPGHPNEAAAREAILLAVPLQLRMLDEHAASDVPFIREAAEKEIARYRKLDSEMTYWEIAFVQRFKDERLELLEQEFRSLQRELRGASGRERDALRERVQSLKSAITLAQRQSLLDIVSDHLLQYYESSKRVDEMAMAIAGHASAEEASLALPALEWTSPRVETTYDGARQEVRQEVVGEDEYSLDVGFILALLHNRAGASASVEAVRADTMRSEAMRFLKRIGDETLAKAKVDVAKRMMEKQLNDPSTPEGRRRLLEERQRTKRGK